MNSPIEEMYIRQLAHHIDIPYLRNGTLRPVDVILNPEDYPEEYKMFMESNLSLPIDINDKREIIDGLDRLVKS